MANENGLMRYVYQARLNVMLWICKFCRPDKEFTPIRHQQSARCYPVIKPKRRSCGNESERGISPSLMRQAARRHIGLRVPLVALGAEKIIRSLPIASAAHHSINSYIALIASARNRPETPPFYVRERTSRAQDLSCHQCRHQPLEKMPQLVIGLRLNPSHSCTSKPTGTFAWCIVRRPSG